MKLTIQHEGKFYIDLSLALGVAHGTAIFKRISDAIRHIRVWNHIDNIFACVESEDADTVFKRLVQLIQAVGLPINDDKVVAPADTMVCLEAEVTFRNCTVHLPQRKTDEALNMIKTFEGMSEVLRQKYQPLLGKLLHVAKIIVPARAFLNRMLSTFP